MTRVTSRWTIRPGATGILAAWLGMLAGCASPAGSWRTVEITPAGAPFPIHQVTFDEKGKYTATGLFTAQGQHDGRIHTTTGAYKLTGQGLSLSPLGGPTLEYRARRRADGKMVLTFKPPGQDRSVTAVLEPTPTHDIAARPR